MFHVFTEQLLLIDRYFYLILSFLFHIFTSLGKTCNAIVPAVGIFAWTNMQPLSWLILSECCNHFRFTCHERWGAAGRQESLPCRILSCYVLNTTAGWNNSRGLRSLQLTSSRKLSCWHVNIGLIVYVCCNQMYGRFFLNVAVTQSAAIFDFLAMKGETLVVEWNPFFVENFLFYVLDTIAW